MICEKCGTNRKTKHCTGPGLHGKGLDLCRKCWQAYKGALARIKQREAGQKVTPPAGLELR